MAKKAFDKIAEGLNEALDIARGAAKPARLHVPAEIDVRRTRMKAGDLTQDDFAAVFGFSVTQIKDWEQGRSRPLGALRAYLMMIECAPNEVRDLLAAAAQRAIKCKKSA